MGQRAELLARVNRLLDALAAGASSTKEKEEKEGEAVSGGTKPDGRQAGADAIPTSPIEAARAAAGAAGEATEKLRRRNDLAARALLSGGLSAISALGILAWMDVFPFPDAFVHWWLPLVLGLGALAAATGVVLVALRYFEIQRPLVMLSDLDSVQRINGLDTDEIDLLRLIYDANAQVNGVRELADYEARGHRLRRVADRLTDGRQAKKLRDQADLISAEVDAILRRARHALVLRRTDRAARSRRTMGGLALIVIGVVVAAVASDAIQSGQTKAEESAPTGQLAFYRDCATTSRAGVTQGGLDKVAVDLGGDETLPCPTMQTPPASVPSSVAPLAAAVPHAIDLALHQVGKAGDSGSAPGGGPQSTRGQDKDSAPKVSEE